jgi:hypothetical protein
MSDKQIEIEWAVLIALFRATVEQTGMLQGVQRHQAKVIFKRWEAEGVRLVKMIESMSDEDKLDDITGMIQDAVHQVRSFE